MRGDYYSDYGERPAAGRRSVVLRVLDWVLTPVTVAVGAAMLLTYFVPYVNPGRVWFLPVLGLAAPGVYVASVVLLLYWIIRWRWVQAGAMLLLVAAGLGKVSLFWRPEIRRSYEEKISERGTFGVMTYNVRGFYGEEYESARFGAEKDPDPSDDAGLAILSKYRILRSETVLTPHSSVWADVLIGDDTVRIFNDHLHSTAINADDNEYITTRRFLSDTAREVKLRSIVTRLRENSELRAAQVDSIAAQIGATRTGRIVCGDFNDTPVSYVYRRMAAGLEDAFSRCGSGYSHTYRGFFNTLRIDYVLYSDEFRAVAYGVLPVEYSDHHPVVVRLKRLKKSS